MLTTKNEVFKNVKEVKQVLDKKGNLKYVVVVQNSNPYRKQKTVDEAVQNKAIGNLQQGECTIQTNEKAVPSFEQVSASTALLDKVKALHTNSNSYCDKSTISTLHRIEMSHSKLLLSKYARGILEMNIANAIAMENLYDTGGDTISKFI